MRYILVILLCLSNIPISFSFQYKVNQDRIETRILALGNYGKNPEGGVSRVAFSLADIKGREYMMQLMKDAGLDVSIDAAGNIIGRRKGNNSNAKPIMFGSHIDSVPFGGNYDGDVGSIGALEVMEVLKENNILTEHPLEMIIFSDEEGGLVGSRALIGELSDQALQVISHSGKTIEQGIKDIGGDPSRLDGVIRKSGDITAFLELHIEQGAILDDEDIEIGVVEGIVGIDWWDITIEGLANHAGTTPMNKRQDAMLAAAHLIVAINETVTGIPGRQVGTVGRIKAEPGAPNVIPGKVIISLEIRDLSGEKIMEIFQSIKQRATEIANNSRTKITFNHIDVSAIPAPTDPKIRELIIESCKELKLSYISMPSGAGHDAQDMAKIAPTGMIFVPSAKGISHSPIEYTKPEDMANGVQVLLQSILEIDKTKN